ncbi:hypothetical protein B0T19DRAFT_457327 [Cercophora scortea]|uniref:Uncharacterized protein n=1 Tax=Cercophora scortea TaxID=314031 RepID=A0AAE0IX17_9PEZI|nr:hypothetical protein B0T19DRAFT_457327 [Cercophora scortea]
MAPAASSNTIHPQLDLGCQTIENCKFFSRPDAVLSLVIAKEPLGTFKALVLKAEDGERDVLLSAPGPTVNEAVHALHVKSAEAVQYYIATNGFEFVPILKKRANDDDGDDAGSDNDSSCSSPVTVSEATSVCDSDDETATIGSPGKPKARGGNTTTRKGSAKHADKGGKPRARHSRSRSRSRSRSPSRSSSASIAESDDDDDDDDDEDDNESYNHRHHHPPPRIMPPNRMRCTPPRLIPNWSPSGPAAPSHPPMHLRMPPFPPGTAPPPPPPRPSAFYAGSTPILPGPPSKAPTTTPPPSSTSTSASPLAQGQDICLLIRWRHHGEQRALEQVRTLSVRAIQDAAIAYVRRQPGVFSNVSAFDAAPARLAHMRASVGRVAVGGDEYDISGWPGDDLQCLVEFASSSSAAASAAAAGVRSICIRIRMDMDMGMGMGMDTTISSSRSSSSKGLRNGAAVCLFVGGYLGARISSGSERGQNPDTDRRTGGRTVPVGGQEGGSKQASKQA